jgi:hypothetical protein
VSSQRYAAQVPLSTQVGDLIFLPLDSAIPFIIRLNSSRDGFELTGEGYVHRIMNEEAVGERFDVVDIHMLKPMARDWFPSSDSFSATLSDPSG